MYKLANTVFSKKRQKRIEGARFIVPVGDNEYCFGKIGKFSKYFFYDFKLNADLPIVIESIFEHRVIFHILVDKDAITSARWPILDIKELSSTELLPTSTFIQNSITKEISIYTEGNIRPATISECIGLERSASWSADHVEDRLRDHFNGVPNKWVESLKLIL
jgi:Immunity protein 26